MTWPAFFYPHEVWVRDLLEDGGRGQQWADTPGRRLRAEVKDEQQLVRDSGGREVVSSTQVSVSIDAHVRVGALVTVWKNRAHEREAEVLAVSVNDNTGSPLDSFLLLSLK